MNFYKIFSHQLVSIRNAPNDLRIIEFYYPQINFFGQKYNRYLLRKYIRKFHGYLVKNDIIVDLVHAQSIVNAGIMAQYFFEETQIAFVFTEHNQFSYRSISNVDKAVINSIFLQPFAKLVVSHDKIRQLVSNKLYADYTVVGNTVDNEVFHWKERDESDTFNITTIGNFSIIKDHVTIFKALQIVDEKVQTLNSKKIRFLWVGYSGWGANNDNEVQQLIKEYPLNNIDVILIPKISREEVRDYLVNSDLFVLSSISEGMPVSVMEALACGVPVCVTRCGGVDELVDYSNGEIFQIRDFQSIAEFILKFDKQDLKFNRKEISANFIEKWGADQFRKKMKSIYQQMITVYGKTKI